MPLPNRVDPFGNLFAASARSTLMGNRGGKFHTDGQRLTSRRWVSRQWICCVLEFHGRRRDVWGRYYTELFFLDEVTAFAAGHRPCFECRRKDAERFALLFAGADPKSVRAHRVSARTMDDALHAERLDGKAKRLHRRKLDALPDAAMVLHEGEPWAVRGRQLLHWTPDGYDMARARLHALDIDVLTPPSILSVLARGYPPCWHPSADR